MYGLLHLLRVRLAHWGVVLGVALAAGQAVKGATWLGTFVINNDGPSPVRARLYNSPNGGASWFTSWSPADIPAGQSVTNSSILAYNSNNSEQYQFMVSFGPAGTPPAFGNNAWYTGHSSSAPYVSIIAIPGHIGLNAPETQPPSFELHWSIMQPPCTNKCVRFSIQNTTSLPQTYVVYAAFRSDPEGFQESAIHQDLFSAGEEGRFFLNPGESQ